MPNYLIENLMPTCEVHLVAGVTGAGKTTWLFGMLLDWERGLPVLGCKSNPVPWVYVAADRSIASAHRTMGAMGINPSAIRMIAAQGADHKDFGAIMGAVADAGAELAVVEAFGSFVDEGGTHRQVSEFMHRACAYTAPQSQFPNGLTILGVVESPKMKPNERYLLPRQRISGVATWGHLADCIFLIEHEKPQEHGHPGRKLYICPRVGRDLERASAFDSQNRLIFP